MGWTSLCESPLWDWDQSWNSEHPRLSPCFRQIVLSILPCCVLWVLTIFNSVRSNYAFNALKKPPNPSTILSVFKQISTSLLILCSVIQGCYLLYVRSKGPDTSLMYVSIIVKILTFILALFLQFRQKRDGRLSSDKLATFWVMLSVCQTFASPPYDLLTDNLSDFPDITLFVLETMSYFFILAQGVLSLFTDPQYSSIYPDSTADECLLENQSPLSRLLFSWIFRLIKHGYKNLFTVQDLDALRLDMRVEHVYKQFLNSWKKEEEIANELKSSHSRRTWCNRKPSLILALARALWPWFLSAAILELLYNFLSLAPAIVLDWLIAYMDNTEPQWHGYIYALFLFASAAVSALLMVHNQHFLVRASVIPRSGIDAALFNKVFRLSLNSRRSYTIGELSNLIAVDAMLIFQQIWSINQLWSYPVRIALVIALLWKYLGVACLSGVAVMLLLMPATTVLTIYMHKIQRTQMVWKDSRLRLMSQILNGIKVLKLFAWEKPFIDRVCDIREKETRALKRLAFLNGLSVFLWISSPFLVALASFLTFVLIDEKNILDPSIAFVSLTLFKNLQNAMSQVPVVINEVVQTRISVKRVFNFLLSEELESSKSKEDPPGGCVLYMKGANFSWGGEEPFLRDLKFSVGSGQLVGIVGRVGSGKSALLTAILGEMVQTGGDFRLQKNLRSAYVAQDAFIQNATVRQNILFMSSMDKCRYDIVMEKCCLKPDVKILTGGDLAEIGERGVNLSGGQKQRISIARAVYQDADFYLLDDPLSAVDANVSQKIFTDVIGPKGMLRNKTRLLVTHDLSLLRDCDAVILMSEGRIAEYGYYKDLIKKGTELARLVQEFKAQTEANNEEDITPSPDPDALSTEDLKKQMRRLASRLSRTGSVSLDREPEIEKSKKVHFIEKEKMEIGGVKSGVYWAYLSSASYVLCTFILISFATHRAFEIGSNVWLSWWSTDPPLPDGSQDIPLRTIRMVVYGLLGFAQSICILLGTIILAFASTRASIKLHREMLWKVMRSPLAFFDTTPVGRVLNRFGNDINSVDIAIPGALNNVMTIVISCLGTIGIICANHPLFLVVLVPLGIIYIALQLFYMSSSRQIRRLMSVTMSPILSFFSEAIQGASTIRAFNAQEFFCKKQNTLVNDNCRSFYNSTLLNRWLAVRLQLIGAVIILVASVMAVVQRRDYSAAIVGLTLSYALSVTDILTAMVRQVTLLETKMISVERIEEYSTLEEEASWNTDRCYLDLSEWPSEGCINFRGYKMRYRAKTDLVLRDIDLDIPGGQKVGVVGRTGAGKSSLAMALFRVVEPLEGYLFIDNIDIATVGLHDLRSKITVIPQDPILFGGSLRTNLDPGGEFSDAEVWTALKLSRIDFGGEGLDMVIEESGENFSVGQRQQICLARALLKRTKILVLDEATAAVDFETDRLIQETIRSEFQGCTVITVAHRLHTILDYDRILVMDKGRIVEDGPPDMLLKRKDSLFRELARAAGLL